MVPSTDCFILLLMLNFLPVKSPSRQFVKSFVIPERRRKSGKNKIYFLDYMKFPHVIHGAELCRRQLGRETKAEDE